MKGQGSCHKGEANNRTLCDGQRLSGSGSYSNLELEMYSLIKSQINEAVKLTKPRLLQRKFLKVQYNTVQ